jgi:hypothetical protein
MLVNKIFLYFCTPNFMGEIIKHIDNVRNS